MAKDPAFLFYTGDFSTGTQFFSDEQVGKYVRLLMAQHQIGHLEEKHMIKICGSYDKDIFSKFLKDSEGKFFNERLEQEVVKRKKYSESRSLNRSSEKNICSTYVSHMENENINKDINININKDINKDMWVFEKKLFINDFNFKEKICREKNILMIPLEKYMNEYISDIELKEDFKEVKELKRHFINWLNLKLKIPQNGTISKQQGQASAIRKLIETGKAEFAALRKENSGA